MTAPCIQWNRAYLRSASATPTAVRLFRSEPLETAAHKVFPFSCHTAFDGAMVEAFREFCTLRQELLRAAPRKAQSADSIVKRETERPKSLLVTDWSASLFDGALEPESAGFIDAEGMPPWDTWIDLVQVDGSFGLCCLLSWVPRWLADRVGAAIQADAAESLSWLTVGDKLRLNGWGAAWDGQ